MNNLRTSKKLDKIIKFTASKGSYLIGESIRGLNFHNRLILFLVFLLVKQRVSYTLTRNSIFLDSSSKLGLTEKWTSGLGIGAGSKRRFQAIRIESFHA